MHACAMTEAHDKYNSDFPPDRDFLRITQSLGEQPSSRVAALWRWIKFVAAVLLLLPIRVIVLLIVCPLIWLMYRLSICLACCSSKTDSSLLASLSRAQKAVIWLNTPLYRIVVFCFGIVCVRERHQRTMQDSDQKGVPYTIVANHVSMFDGPIMGVVLGCQLTGVSANWVTKLPLCSTIAKGHQVLAVGRKKDAQVAPTPEGQTKKSATDTIVEYQRQCAADHSLLPLLVFPEGATKAARCLLKFRTGAFVSGEPVRPVALRYPECMAWVQPTLKHMLFILTRWLNFVEIIWLPLYIPSSAEKSNPELYANNVQALMASAMGLPEKHVSTTMDNVALSAALANSIM